MEPIKGRISVPDRGTGITLMFNPENVKDAKETNWGTKAVPGASHPVYQFGSGGERLLTFDIFLDGERGKASRSSKTEEEKTLSIAAEIAFFQSLLYPNEYSSGAFGKVHPPLCLFTMGILYREMTVVVKKADVDITYWTKDMDPMRAKVSLSLAQHVEKSVVANSVYSDFVLKDIEFNGEKLRKRRGELF